VTEPTYVYIKGEGWLVETAPVVTMGCGTKVRLELRNPKEGEHYMCCNKKLNPEPLRVFLERCTFQHYKDRIICDEGHEAYYKYVYCVLVPV
jgi:hypothetical protein